MNKSNLIVGQSTAANLKVLVSGADLEDDEDDEDYAGEDDDVIASPSVDTPKELFSPTTPKETKAAATSAAPAMYSVFCKGRLKFSKKSGVPIWAGFWAESLKELGPGSHTRYKFYYEKKGTGKDEKKDGARAVDPAEFSGTYKGYFMVKNQLEPTGTDIRKKEMGNKMQFKPNADQPGAFTVRHLHVFVVFAAGCDGGYWS